MCKEGIGYAKEGYGLGKEGCDLQLTFSTRMCNYQEVIMNNQMSDLVKASTLNCGDVVLDSKGKEYIVEHNIVGDTIFLLNRNSNPYDGFHLFYDDEYSEDSEHIARVKFNLELT